MSDDKKIIRDQALRIAELKDILAEVRRWETAAVDRADRCGHELRKLRDACRSTNRGIARLSKRCQSQAKKIAELKLLLEDAAAVLRLKDSAPALRESIDIALHVRRPAEKAT